MEFLKLFSKRQKSQIGTPDIYQYEKIDNKFRVQVVHIIRDTIGTESDYNNLTNETYAEIHRLLCKEYGVFSLKEDEYTQFNTIYNHFLQTKDYIRCLDIIELTFNFISTKVKEREWEYQGCRGVIQSPENAIKELNYRFKEACIGYQFESGELIRIDSQIIHAEAVKPVLHILSSEKIYQGANDEFLKAYEHYRHKRYKECLVDCLKSFESLMKAICDKQSWKYNKTDTAKNLINVCLTNNLVPSYLQNQLASIRILLESGVPTVRNKIGGHGQGASISNVPEHFASYLLHLTATNLLFLAKCNDDLS